MSWTSSSLATFTLQECPGSAACSRCGSLGFSPSLWVHFLNSEAGVCSCSSQTRQCHWVNSVLGTGPVRLWSHPPKHATSSKDQAPMEQSCRDEHTDSVRVKSVPVWDPSTALCCRLWKHAHLFIGGNHWELYITLGELSFLVLSWELSTSHPQAWGVQHTEQALTLPGFQPAPQTTKQQKDLAELNSLRMVFLSNAMSSLNETCEGFFCLFLLFFFKSREYSLENTWALTLGNACLPWRLFQWTPIQLQASWPCVLIISWCATMMALSFLPHYFLSIFRINLMILPFI